MAGPVERGGPEGTNHREETPPPLTKKQIEGHVSTLKSLIKSYNQRNKGGPIRLDFESQGCRGPKYKMPANIKLYDGTTDLEDHLSRFASAANSGEWPMPVWCQMFQQTLDGSAIGLFEHLSHDSINEWADLREAFAARYSVRRACFKEPHEITKIVRKANESLTAFKERWTVETSFIMGVLEVMKISSFMDAVKSPELAKLFSNKVPATVNEMMERLDDFVRSEEAYARTELPIGEVGETHRRASLIFNRRNNRSHKNTATFTSSMSHVEPIKVRKHRSVLRLSLGKKPLYKRLHQAHKAVRDGVRVGQIESFSKRCATKRKRTPRQGGPQPAKVINVISVNSMKDMKRKGREVMNPWMNVPISFPAISSDDVFEEPLIIEAEVEGYLVRRVYVDEGSSVEVMFEHCFENLDSRIKAKLKETRTDLVGFAGEISKPLGKIKLEVCFGNGGLRRRTSMKFIIVRAPSPCNIILGRPVLKTFQAIPSIIHSMMKFLTLRGVATLVTWTIIIAECRCLERKQMVEESFEGKRGVAATKEVLINPSFSDQRVTIGRGLSEACRDQLKHLLKDNIGVFAWEPFDMTGVPHQIVEHTLNVNPSMDPIQMAEEDEEKTAFYTDQGTYCYTKMPFRLKNATATYQRLVDSTFKCQIGMNLKAYVYDMVIKSKDEKMLLADIAETFDNLKKINMKLNPKKCSFGVEEEKFLGRFLAKSVERSLPFFNTLKNITKENRHEFRWTKEAEKAFKQIKNLIMDLPSLTLPWEKGDLICVLGSISRGHGASSLKGSGACLVLIWPSGIEYTYALRLTFPSTNNEVEYEALLAGLTIAWQMNISNIEVKVDSKLVASQINRSYEACKDNMIKNMNQKADVLSKLTSVAFNHLTKEDKNEARCLRAKIGQYAMKSEILFKSGYLVPMLRCVGPLQANYVIREIHMGSCGMHVGPRAVVRKAVRQRYYWPTMHEDAKKEVEKCDSCQIHALVPRLSKTLITSIMAPWPFYQWGMDILGSLPPAKRGAKFVIVAIDYFTKWIEAKPLVKITGNELVNDPFKSLCGRFEIYQMNTAVAHPQANGLVERANRSLMEGIKTRLGKEKSRWVDELPNVLWAHRTSIKQSNGETPFSLTYGSEAAIPAETGMPTYRTLMIRE
uniref:Integrase catalytic domain-containing protein n=1 Tax=Tanacetum cinerariifolium TaxID=118510 RepID=A0A699GVQ5_TANCI|nr:hypothetical protein [Tanacetum cinerariifolium]